MGSIVEKKKWTSQEIKDLMIQSLNFFTGYVGAVTEASNFNAADVVAVKHNGRIQEFEIKVSKADLVGEMRCARVSAGLEHRDDYTSEDGLKCRLSYTKLRKHQLYLDMSRRQEIQQWGSFERHFIPDNFYWCIPIELFTVCMELNKGLPYGIYVINPTAGMANILHVPKNLKPPETVRLYKDLFNRACTQWSDSRERIRQLEQKLRDAGVADV